MRALRRSWSRPEAPDSAVLGPRKDVAALFAASLIVCTITLVSVWATGALIERWTPWRDFQDPRMELLWDPGPDGSAIVMLGDSAFASYYVDAPGDALWAQLAMRAGVRVFPGALNGATLADLRCAAALVAGRWPPGTVVLLDLHPYRLFSPGTGLVASEHRYEQQFARLGACPATTRGAMQAIDAAITTLAARHLFLVRGRDWIQTALATRVNGRRFFRVGGSRNRTWDADGRFAVERLHDFEQVLAGEPGRQGVPETWLDSVVRPLAASGMRIVFVLTPLNRALLELHASQSTLETVLKSHTDLKAYLRRADYEFIDLFGKVESPGFADAIHMNALGDRQAAALIAAALIAAPRRVGS